MSDLGLGDMATAEDGIHMREAIRWHGLTAEHASLFIVYPQTPCHARYKGGEWRHHFTKTRTTFSNALRHEGHKLFFKYGDWELAINDDLVKRPSLPGAPAAGGESRDRPQDANTGVVSNLQVTSDAPVGKPASSEPGG